MKKLIYLICLLPFYLNCQPFVLDIRKNEQVATCDMHYFMESLAWDNHLTNSTHNYSNLYSTFNYHIVDPNFPTLKRVMGNIHWRDINGVYIQHNAVHNASISSQDSAISIVNCTQTGENLLVSGTQYLGYTGTALNPIRSFGILMASNNPNNFAHDIIEFRLNTYLGMSPLGGASDNKFVFITDAVKDNAGNIYAVGTINNNMNNFGVSFFVILNSLYNVVDFRLSPNAASTFERIVYDDSDSSIYFIGKGKTSGTGLHPIICRYDIVSANLITRVFDQNEVFFDIKKDLTTNEIVVGWTEGHHHDIGLLFFDNSLTLLSTRTWDNHSNINFNAPYKPATLRPYSIFISDNSIFFKGTAMITHNNTANFWWYSHFYYSTDRFNYTTISTATSPGLFQENSSNPLFQTMNGMHPWFPKRMFNFHNDIVSSVDNPRFSLFTGNNNCYKFGIDYLSNYNNNTSLVINQNPNSLSCHPSVATENLSPNNIQFHEISPEPYEFISYPIYDDDILVHMGLSLFPQVPIQDSCNNNAIDTLIECLGCPEDEFLLKSTTNPIQTKLIKSYQLYSSLGQVIDNRYLSIEIYLSQVIKDIKDKNYSEGIYLINFQTITGEFIRRKIRL